MAVIKKGARGDEVKTLQTKLAKLGYDVGIDGVFGGKTETAIKNLQQTWGYDVDGLVGDGTTHLIDKRLGEGWNLSQPDALKKAAMAVDKAKGGK